MSSQKGNVAKKGPPKHQNKTAWKNVYHDTSKRTKQIATTVVSGVCQRCKDVIDWKIKYKKYKLMSQPKTCVTCKQKAVKHSYHVYCIPCASKRNICAKCGEDREIVVQPSLSAAEQSSQERQLQFELEQLPERKRRTFFRLQEQGKLTDEALRKLDADHDDDDDFSDESDDDDDLDEVNDNHDNKTVIGDSSNVKASNIEKGPGKKDGTEKPVQISDNNDTVNENYKTKDNTEGNYNLASDQAKHLKEFEIGEAASHNIEIKKDPEDLKMSDLTVDDINSSQ